MVHESSWKFDNDQVSAIQKIPNKKRTKRMDKQLDKYEADGEMFARDSVYDSQVQHVLLSAKYIKRLHELVKGSKTNFVDLHVQTDKPVVADFYGNEKQDRGKIVIAPKIIEDTDQHLKRSRFKDTEKEESEVTAQ